MRIQWLDFAKVFGIWIVVYGHTPNHLFGEYISSFHMPLFFMISGYLYKIRKIREEFIHGFRTLIVPYLLFNLLLMPFCTVHNYLIGKLTPPCC